MVDVARALKRDEIVRLLEEYEHINEFVCATFAGDLKEMMNIIALGVGKSITGTTSALRFIDLVHYVTGFFLIRESAIDRMHVHNINVIMHLGPCI